MLSYIPRLHPGEIFKSIESRFHSHTLSSSISKTKRLLFGARDVNISLHFPTKLDYFIEQTYGLLQIDIETLLNEFTLWPFYMHFIKKKKHDQIKRVMKEGKLSGASASIGINGSGFFLTEIPKYCPECNKHNIELYGELFWMRIHQIPNIIVCPIHNCFLEESVILEGSPYKTPIYTLSNQSCPISIPRRNSNSLLFNISKFMVNILNHKIELNFDYRQQAKSLGYTKNGFIDQVGLSNDIASFFSSELLEFYFPTQGLKSPKFFTKQLINEGYKILHPTRHILLQYFLKTAKPKPKSRIPFHDLLEKNHKCRNPICKGFKVNICKSFDLHYEKKRKTSIGYYKCRCGMVYSHGIKNGNRELNENFRVKKYGDLWDTTFKEMYYKNSTFEMMDKFDISSESVKRHALRLKLNFNKVDSKKIGKGLIVKDKKISNRLKVKIKRERFIELQKLNLGKQVIRKSEFGRVIEWLKLNDPVWIQNHHIKSYFHKNQKSNIDVMKIDKEFVKKLENAFNELVSSKDSRRITKTQILRKAKILSRHLNLPLCNEFLNKNSESIEDFQIRRIKNVAEILSANGEIITVPKLLYGAHIWKRTEKVVKAASKIANLY